jgi:Gpi18-like mannosyltransferase
MKLLKFIKKQLIISNFKFILLSFLIWRLSLFIILFLAINFIPLAGSNFLGGGLKNYLQNPWLFGWANFDGEHYLSIAQKGYQGLEQAFFPIYPGLIHVFTKPFGLNLFNLTLVGILIANLSFLIAITFLYQLILIDYSEKIAKLSIILLLLFPTSFYFGSLYSESLFLLMISASFYLMRKNDWLGGSMFGAISGATRVFGVILLPAFLIEAYLSKKSFKQWLWALLIPVGLIIYMIYQALTVGDSLAFYHLQKTVGPQHSTGITLLPQIYFRYLKILITTPLSNPIYQTEVLELIIGILFLLLPIYGYFKKLRLSYLIFSLLAFLAPTIQGSFSSLPRYVIILFPSFIALALFINGLPKWLKIVYFIFSGSCLVIESALFLRAFWVA